MIDAGTKIIYKAFGFTIDSEIPLPELTQMEYKEDSIDIEITISEITDTWNELSDPQYEFVVKPDFVMFQVPKCATFAIMDGKKIIVSPLEEYDEDVTRLYLLGTGMGAVLLQRKIYPLHGSALNIDGKAYAIIGESGAGKSTLAAALLNEGHQLLTDDVIAVSLSEEDSAPNVIPAYPQQKLWQDSLNNFGVDSENYKSIFGRETKYNVPVHSKYTSTSLPLAGIFELMKTENDEIEFCRIANLDRLYTLFTHTFRNFLIRDLGLMDWHFQTTAKILDHVNVYSIKRPVHKFTTDQLVSTILKIIDQEAK